MATILEQGVVINYNDGDYQDYYFVVETPKSENDYYLLCKTDFKLRGEKPILSDLWNISQRYLDENLANGNITIETKQ